MKRTHFALLFLVAVLSVMVAFKPTQPPPSSLSITFTVEEAQMIAVAVSNSDAISAKASTSIIQKINAAYADALAKDSTQGKKIDSTKAKPGPK